MPLTGVPLNTKQQDELKEAFIIYDTDGRGRVNREQATSICRSIALSPTNEELNKMLGQKEGGFTLSELQQIIASKAPPMTTSEELRECLRIFDKDGNGFIDLKEIRHVLVHLGEKMTDDEVDEFIREVEITGDNQISCDDFARQISQCY